MSSFALGFPPLCQLRSDALGHCALLSQLCVACSLNSFATRRPAMQRPLPFATTGSVAASWRFAVI